MEDDQLARRAQPDPYCSLAPRLVGVTDANALLSSVDNDCRKGFRSRLLLMSDFGTTVLYAADHIYAEVYEHLPTIAKSSPVPLAVLRAHFEEHYLPVLRFVTVSAADIVDPQVLAITDPDDVPTGQLAKLIGPCVVFSEDQHLRKPGFAPQDWRRAAKSAVDLSEGVSTQNVTGGLVLAPGWAASSLIKFVGRKLGVSPWVVGGVAAGGVALMLMNADRRTRFGRAFTQYGVPILVELFSMMEEARMQEQVAIADLEEIILPAPSEPSVRQQVAIVLARQPEPLLAQEIQDLIEQYFPVDVVPTVAEVRAVLREGSEFVQYQRYRWEFGRYAAPWAEV